MKYCYGELDYLLGAGGGRGFEVFSTFNNFIGTSFILLGCQNWDKYDFKASSKLYLRFCIFN